MLEDGVSVGPFAYLRPGTVLRARRKVGTFVEVKNSDIGAGAKVPHLSYIGDADVGEGSNLGAATITANYDGRAKHRTTSRQRACARASTRRSWRRSTVGDDAYTGAGSVITEDVPAGRAGDRARAPAQHRGLRRARAAVRDDRVRPRPLHCLREMSAIDTRTQSSRASLPIDYNKRLMLFSGRANPQLAVDIADKLGVDLGPVTLKTFSNGEVYCRYEESIRGADVFIVQSDVRQPAARA